MKIFELEIPRLQRESFFLKITQLEEQTIVFTPNPEICLKTLQDTEFLNILQQANYLTSDGIGLYIAYQVEDNHFGKGLNMLLLPYFFFNLFFRRNFLYKKYGDRICGSDMTLKLIDFAQENKREIVILDLYSPNDAKKIAYQEIFSQKLKIAYPDLRFQYHIYNPRKKEEILATVQNSSAQIFFSTLGMKQQEISVIEFLKNCPNLKLGLGVGSSFDYITGFQKRAPRFFRQAGLEWLYRIFTSPNKLKRLRRIIDAVCIFPIQVIFRK